MTMLVHFGGLRIDPERDAICLYRHTRETVCRVAELADTGSHPALKGEIPPGSARQRDLIARRPRWLTGEASGREKGGSGPHG